MSLSNSQKARKSRRGPDDLRAELDAKAAAGQMTEPAPADGDRRAQYSVRADGKGNGQAADDDDAPAVYPLHPITHDYADFTEAEETAMRASLRELGLVTPIVLWRDQIVDGRNRERLCCELHINTRYSDLTERCPTEADMRAHVAALNEHRRSRTAPLTIEEKQLKVDEALKADPERSDRVIGDTTGTSHTFVAGRRTKLAAGGGNVATSPAARVSKSGQKGGGQKKSEKPASKTTDFEPEEPKDDTRVEESKSEPAVEESKEDTPVEESKEDTPAEEPKSDPPAEEPTEESSNQNDDAIPTIIVHLGGFILATRCYLPGAAIDKFAELNGASFLSENGPKQVDDAVAWLKDFAKLYRKHHRALKAAS